jgi:hypothetical protein
LKALLNLLLAATPFLAYAQGDTQSVWRCGADGRSYSSTPCADGRPLTLPAPRPSAEVATAQAQAESEKRLADRLLQERMQRENVPAGTGLMGIKHPRAAELRPQSAVTKKHRLARHRHLRSSPFEDGGTWRATAPVSRQKKG